MCDNFSWLCDNFLCLHDNFLCLHDNFCYELTIFVNKLTIFVNKLIIFVTNWRFLLTNWWFLLRIDKNFSNRIKNCFRTRKWPEMTKKVLQIDPFWPPLSPQSNPPPIRKGSKNRLAKTLFFIKCRETRNLAKSPKRLKNKVNYYSPSPKINKKSLFFPTSKMACRLDPPPKRPFFDFFSSGGPFFDPLSIWSILTPFFDGFGPRFRVFDPDCMILFNSMPFCAILDLNFVFFVNFFYFFNFFLTLQTFFQLFSIFFQIFFYFR